MEEKIKKEMKAKEKKHGRKITYAQFSRNVKMKTGIEDLLLWIRRNDLKKETEAFICAAEEQALRTKYVKS